MTRTALSALLSHWRQRPGQLLTLVLGLALATALWSAVQAINAEARAQYARAADDLSAAGRAVITPSNRPFTLSDYAALRRAGWPVSPVLEGTLSIGLQNLPLLGRDMLSLALAMSVDIQSDLSPQDVIGPTGRLLAHPETLATLSSTNPGLPALLSFDQTPRGLLLTDIATAERLLQRPGQIDRLELTGPVPANARQLTFLLPGATLRQPDTPDAARLTDSFHLNLTAFGFLSFAVGLFVVHGIAGLAFEERRTTFRTLRALGVPATTLTRLVLAELIGLALLAGALGVILGYLVAAALLPDVSATLRGLYGAEIGTGLQLRPGWIAGALAMAVAGALAAGLQGVLRLRRMPILATTGPTRWATAARLQFTHMASLGAALVLLGLGGLAYGGLEGSFAAMGGLMLGAALALPAALHWVLTHTARHAKGPVAQWVWADMAAQLPGLSLALMALLLALATTIGVGTMVKSFRLTFTGWLDQRLAAEIYLTAESDAQAAEITAWLDTRADAVLPIRYTDAHIADRPGRIYGIVDHITYRDNWPLLQALDAPWDRLTQGGVLINEQLAYRADLRPGDTFTLGPDWSAQIVGIYSDYGNPLAQAITALPTLLARAPDLPNRQMGIRIAPAQAPKLIAALKDTFDLPPDAIIDQSAIKAFSLDVFDRTFVVTGALSVLTLGVAAFAILTSLLALWSTRPPQLAPAWAMGLNRRQLAMLELARSTGLALLTALAGLPLGLALAWLLLAVVNVEAFGWRLPMAFFPLDWLRAGALAALAGALAALWPARRLLRLPPARLLQVFAHDR